MAAFVIESGSSRSTEHCKEVIRTISRASIVVPEFLSLQSLFSHTWGSTSDRKAADSCSEHRRGGTHLGFVECHTAVAEKNQNDESLGKRLGSSGFSAGDCPWQRDRPVPYR